ncbi:MAG: Ig-like domain-containing protein, partial [Roseiflexaceae bacterium]
TQALLIDTGVPAAPTITSPASVNDTTPTFAGTAEPGSAITVKVDGVTVCTDIVSASGAWSCRPITPLTIGSHNVSVTATDAANNVSPATIQTLIVDTTAPGAPTISMPTVGASVHDTPAFAGTAEPGSTVTVTEGPTTLCTATVDSAGNWSCTPATPLDEGSHTISVTVTDPAGNTSLAAEIPIGVDITAPSAPLITSRSNTLDSKPLLQGTAEPGSIVTVVLDPDNNAATNNSVTYVTTANGLGFWSIDTGSATPTSGTFPINGLAVGTRADVQVVARDAAGNISGVTSQKLFVGTQLYWPLLRAS